MKVPMQSRRFDKRVVLLKDSQGNFIDVDLWKNNIDLIIEQYLNTEVEILNG